MTDSEEADISLIADPNGLRDGYKIEQSGSRLVFRARGIRGLIFAIGMFLRKSKFRAKKSRSYRISAADMSPTSV